MATVVVHLPLSAMRGEWKPRCAYLQDDGERGEDYQGRGGGTNSANGKEREEEREKVMDWEVPTHYQGR